MTFMWEEILEQPAVMERCIQHNREPIARVIADIRRFQPHTVVFAGRGSSDHAGQYGRYLVEIYLGLPVSLASPSVLTAYRGRVNYGGCLVIGISQSGHTQDVETVLRAANAQGALTLAITNDAASPVARAARHHLACEAGPERSIEATKTFATQICLLYQLVAAWSQDPALLDAQERLPGLVSQAIALEAPLRALVPRYRFVQEMFLLARGAALPIAMEGCLKINESSYVRARPFSISDFRHGPIAMAQKDTPILLIDAEPATRGEVGPLIEKMREAQSDLLILTSDQTLARDCETSLLLPSDAQGPESAFSVMALLQMFSCQLALLKGEDPDHPRGLRKITG